MKGFLILHIRLVKNNFFLNISDSCGKLLFIQTAGTLNFTNINKRGLEVFKALILSGFSFLLGLGQHKKNIFLKIEGFKRRSLKLFYKEYKTITYSKFKFLALKVINKVPHNGCRKKYRKL